MSTSHLVPIVRQLIDLTVTVSDRELIFRFRDQNDSVAFANIVRRHGPMVQRVCYRVLGNGHDAEDALQATFLLLARNARSLRSLDSLASWLHGIAYRVSLKARNRSLSRQKRERAVARPEASSPDDLRWSEVSRVLDEELLRLPEDFRQPLLLCYLQGKTQDEAAQHLGWSKTTLRRRLDEAKQALGDRLSKRGVVGTGAFPALLISDSLQAGTLSAELVTRLVEYACFGKSIVPAAMIELCQGVVPMFKLIQFSLATVLLVSFIGLALAFQSPPMEESKKKETPVPELPKGKKEIAAIGPEEKARQDLQGNWRLTKQVNNDKEISLPGERLLSIRGDELWIFGITTAEGKDGAKDRTIYEPLQKTWMTLNPKKNPPEITLVGERFLMQMVYQLEGDTLKLAFFSRSEIDRPQGFRVRDTKENGLSLNVWILERVRGSLEEEKGKTTPPLVKENPLVVDQTERPLKGNVVPAHVKGTVTLKGVPVARAKLILRMGEEEHTTVVKEGKYNSNRLPPGEYKVTLEGEGIPEKFTRLETTPLIFNLRSDTNVFAINLP